MLCKCGCGRETKIYRGKQSTYLRGHGGFYEKRLWGTSKVERIRIMGKWLKENKALGATTIDADDLMNFEEIAEAISIEEDRRVSVQVIHADYLSGCFKVLAHCLGTGIEPEDLAPIWRGSV